MQDMIRVAVDAMGGDNAPDEIIKGAMEAVALREDIQVLLVGKEELIREKLKGYSYREQQVEIVNATEVIETAEPPVAAIRTKKDSSIVVGLKLVKEERRTLSYRQAAREPYWQEASFWWDASRAWRDRPWRR